MLNAMLSPRPYVALASFLEKWIFVFLIPVPICPVRNQFDHVDIFERRIGLLRCQTHFLQESSTKILHRAKLVLGRFLMTRNVVWLQTVPSVETSARMFSDGSLAIRPMHLTLVRV